MRSAIEKYVVEENAFIPLSEVAVLTREDFWDSSAPFRHAVFTDLRLNDIDKTMYRAIKALNKRCPVGGYVSVFTSPRTLSGLIANGANFVPVLDVTIAPDEISNTLSWKKASIAKALGVGCMGFMADFDCGELAQAYPDNTFFRRVPFGITTA